MKGKTCTTRVIFHSNWTPPPPTPVNTLFGVFGPSDCKRTRLTYNCAHLRFNNKKNKNKLSQNQVSRHFRSFPEEKLLRVKIFLGVVIGAGVLRGLSRLTRGRYPPSFLECLSHQDSENIVHC